MADDFEKARLRMQLDAADEERALVPGAARDGSQAERDRLAVQRVSLQQPRGAVRQYAASESPNAPGNATGLYTLLALVVLVLLVLAGVFLTRHPNPKAIFTLDNAAPPMAPVASLVPAALSPSHTSSSSPTASASGEAAPATIPASAAPSTPLYVVPPASTPLPIVPTVSPTYVPLPSDSTTPPASTSSAPFENGSGGNAASAAPSSSTPVGVTPFGGSAATPAETGTTPPAPQTTLPAPQIGVP